MSSVSSDLTTLLSNYRVMAYHNLETGKDEGLVFVKKGDDTCSGELVRWSGESVPTPSPVQVNYPQASSSSTFPCTPTPSVTSSSPRPGRLTSTGSNCAGTSPSTSQKQYESNNNLQSSNNNFSVIKHNPVLPKAKEKVNQESSGPPTPAPPAPAPPTPAPPTPSPPASGHRREDDYVNKSSSDTRLKNTGTNNNIKIKNSDIEYVQSRKSVFPMVNERLNQKSTLSAAANRSKDTNMNRCNSNAMQKSPEKFKIPGEAGWVREVIKGDKKSSHDKTRIAYQPPSALRHIRNRLYTLGQVGTFLSTYCPDTYLTQDNFSFTNQELGLDMPWEVVRHASLKRGKKMSEGLGTSKPIHSAQPASCPKTAVMPFFSSQPATCLHCGQPLPLGEEAAAQHVRRCLHAKNSRMRAVLEGVDYSPMQHARPVNYKQSMPSMNSKQDILTKTDNQLLQRVKKAGPPVLPARGTALVNSQPGAGQKALPAVQLSCTLATLARQGGQVSAAQARPSVQSDYLVAAEKPKLLFDPAWLLKTAGPASAASVLAGDRARPGPAGHKDRQIRKSAQPALARHSQPAGDQGGLRAKDTARPVFRPHDAKLREKKSIKVQQAGPLEESAGLVEEEDKSANNQAGPHASASLSLNNLPDCISVSKLRL